ncbi:metal-dependent protein hydrolase [Actinidia rufa]|uniref:Metal-dependent protein hydrolase n=1 Tax=Actinidia rufa TaxID=165716 RepID=A0A7J0DP80_9ERIC|nr:metal-dependent protein hydrolase [Actinidia rufa]
MIRITNNFSAAEILRTRGPLVLETLDAVLDVGGVYDPSRDSYDHHQKGFKEGFVTLVSEQLDPWRRPGHGLSEVGRLPPVLTGLSEGPPAAVDVGSEEGGFVMITVQDMGLVPHRKNGIPVGD